MSKMVTNGTKGKASTSCTECQRRKQKCSREWPCNHCQSRNLAHLCQFGAKTTKLAEAGVEIPQTPASLKRTRSGSIKESPPDFKSNGSTISGISELQDEGFRALGYMPGGSPIEMSISSYSGMENGLTPSNSFEMQSSLTAIPPKPYTDILVQHFLKEINFQYYMLYPPTFSQEYASWWSNRADGRKLSPAFTTLLLRICACSAQFISGDTRRNLEVELGEKVEKLSERYHKAAQKLSLETSPGKGGLTQVQQLFLAACWFKAEALFTESWHALGSAIHEAQELGMHKESSNTRLSEFECEMRKRAWCILYIWDWQMSASLSRPRIINSSNFKAPKPSLEKSSTEEPPSPFTHVLFQFELGQRLSKVPGIAADTLAPSQISVFKAEIERWLSELPSTYNLSAPDTKWDAKCQYIVPQRIQLNALGYMILFQQLKSFLVKPEAKNAEEINLRKVGIECALKLVDIARQDVEIEFPIHTKFCFAIFVIFDTAATLCSAVIHDPSGKLPRRTKVIEGIGSLLRLLEMIKDHAKTAAVCHGILSRLVANMPVVLPEYYSGLPGVTMSPSDIFKTQEDSPLENLSATDTSGLNDAVNDNLFDAGISGLPDAALDFSLAEAASTQDWLPGVGNFSIMDLGAIDQELYWDSLDLNLPFEPLPKN